jgi:hypothetical protein
MLEIASHHRAAARRNHLGAWPGNWTKRSLYNLRLMDSVPKESQDMKPTAIGTLIDTRREDCLTSV